MNLDFFAICAHPDDLEVCAGGIFLQARQAGLRTGAVVLTDGGASGKSAAGPRRQEALDGARALRLSYFRQLDFPDAALQASQEVIEAVIPHVRATSPRVLFAMHPEDYHPDHVAASKVAEAVTFTAMLRKWSEDGKTQWHPEALLHFAADPRTVQARPDLLFDIGDMMEEKLAACRAHVSQKVEPYAISLSRFNGLLAGCEYAEGLYIRRALKVQSIARLFAPGASAL